MAEPGAAGGAQGAGAPGRGARARWHRGSGTVGRRRAPPPLRKPPARGSEWTEGSGGTPRPRCHFPFPGQRPLSLLEAARPVPSRPLRAPVRARGGGGWEGTHRAGAERGGSPSGVALGVPSRTPGTGARAGAGRGPGGEPGGDPAPMESFGLGGARGGGRWEPLKGGSGGGAPAALTSPRGSAGSRPAPGECRGRGGGSACPSVTPREVGPAIRVPSAAALGAVPACPAAPAAPRWIGDFAVPPRCRPRTPCSPPSLPPRVAVSRGRGRSRRSAPCPSGRGSRFLPSQQREQWQSPSWWRAPTSRTAKTSSRRSTPTAPRTSAGRAVSPR